MPLRRVALCFAAFVLFCVSLTSDALAQFIVLRAPTQSYVTEALYTKRSPAHKMSEQASFSYVADTPDSIDVSNGDGPFDYLGTIHNLDSHDLSISYIRVQSLPCGWSSSVCFGGKCFDAAQDSEAYVFSGDSSLSLIVHVYPSVDTVPHNSIMYLTLKAASGNPSDSILIPIRLNYQPAADIKRFAWNNVTFTKTFNGPKKHSVSGLFANKSCDSVLYHFTLQSQVPSTWTWKCCVADASLNETCFSSSTMDYPFEPVRSLSTDDAHKITFSTTPPDNFTTTDSAVFTLHVQSPLHARDSGTYRFSIIAKAPQNGVSAPESMRAGITVLNAWPNPIKSNATLNLDLMTDRHGPAEAHIYDMGGSEVATFDLGDLSIGSNRLVVSDIRLTSGEYILRLEQDGATSGPVRLNIVR